MITMSANSPTRTQNHQVEYHMVPPPLLLVLMSTLTAVDCASRAMATTRCVSIPPPPPQGHPLPGYDGWDGFGHTSEGMVPRRYSDRMARSGSTRAARQAGTRLATRPAAPRAPSAAASVAGSKGRTP